MSLESRTNLLYRIRGRHKCDAFKSPEQRVLTRVFESGHATLFHISIVIEPELKAHLWTEMILTWLRVSGEKIGARCRIPV
jgi:hypothetical protein